MLQTFFWVSFFFFNVWILFRSFVSVLASRFCFYKEIPKKLLIWLASTSGTCFLVFWKVVVVVQNVAVWRQGNSLAETLYVITKRTQEGIFKSGTEEKENSFRN